jgi:polyisoprenoid-binding protein YceI
MKSLKTLSALTGVIVLALAATAASAQPRTADKPWLDGTFTIDPYHTFTTFQYDHFGLSTGRGRFDKTTGEIVIDAAHRRASTHVTIDVNSLDTGVPLLDERLKSQAFFDAKAFPTITFVSRDFHFRGEALTSVDGALTIKGVTRPVKLEVVRSNCKAERNPTMRRPACGADATLTLNRSDYGVRAFAPLVSDRIDILITVEAMKGAEGIEDQFSRLRPATSPAPPP